MNKDYIIKNIEKSLVETEDITKNTLPNEIFELEGMSGKLYRQFINHLLKNLGSDVSFLEIGTWKGSTSISALYENLKNIKKYWLIDNWSLFGGPKQEFIKNFKNIIKQEPNFIEGDCFKINPKDHGIENVNVYFYDGQHEESDQEKALSYYYDCLEDIFVYIVDDWFWDFVRKGTYNGLKKNNLNIIYQKEYKEFYKDTKANLPETWHNGISIFVLEK